MQLSWKESFLGVIISAAGFFAFQLSIMWFPKKLCDINKYLKRKDHKTFYVNFIAFIHSAIAGYVAFYAAIYPEQSTLDDLIYGYSSFAQYVYIFSSGYFLWDIIICVYYKYWGFLAHGLAAFFCFSNALYPLFHYHGMFFLAYELSTPFYHIRWFLGKIGKENSTVYIWVTRLFVVTFFVVRIIMGFTKSWEWYILIWPYVTGKRECHSRFVFLGYILCNIILNGLNLHWGSSMFKLLSPKKKKK